MISLTHLISSHDHVHSFQCVWFQKFFEKKKENIVPEHRKNHAHESVSIKRENLPNAYKLYITSV